MASSSAVATPHVPSVPVDGRSWSRRRGIAAAAVAAMCVVVVTASSMTAMDAQSAGVSERPLSSRADSPVAVNLEQSRSSAASGGSGSRAVDGADGTSSAGSGTLERATAVHDIGTRPNPLNTEAARQRKERLDVVLREWDRARAKTAPPSMSGANGAAGRGFKVTKAMRESLNAGGNEPQAASTRGTAAPSTAAMPKPLWQARGSELRYSATPVRFSAAQRTALLEWGSAEPQPDGRMLPTFTFGAAKSGSTVLYHAVVYDAYHVLPWVTPGIGPLGMPLRVKELASQLVLRMRMAYFREYDAFDNPNDILPQATREGIVEYCGGANTTSTACGKDPETQVRLPVVVYDGSVYVHHPAFVNAIHDCWQHVLDRLRYTMTIKDPVLRAESAYWHRVDEWLDDAGREAIDIDDTLTVAVDFAEQCRAGCEARDAQNWYLCCWVAYEDATASAGHDGSAIVDAAVNWILMPSFYAENLRYAYCVLVLQPMGIQCPSWADPAIDGLLSYDNQHRVLVLTGDEVAEDVGAVTARITRHIGVPNDRIPSKPGASSGHSDQAERAAGNEKPGAWQQPVTDNEHKHRREVSPSVMARLARLFADDDARLRRLLGRELPWDLGSYGPARM